MIVIRAVENGFIIHDEHPESSRSYYSFKTWIAANEDQLKSVVSELAEKEIETLQQQRKAEVLK